MFTISFVQSKIKSCSASTAKFSLNCLIVIIVNKFHEFNEHEEFHFNGAMCSFGLCRISFNFRRVNKNKLLKVHLHLDYGSTKIEMFEFPGVALSIHL